MTAITLDLRPLIDLSDEQFYQLCQANPDIRLERTANGELIGCRQQEATRGNGILSISLELGLKTQSLAWF